ncbi:MAG: hypothetical protein Q3972_03815 [Corynebacterium sp.]|nr:hypothetical protein [Corynebacterium sp.]
MKTYAIEYEYDANNPLIGEVRPAHREFLGNLKNQGMLIGSGPYIGGGALIVIRLPEGTTPQSIMDEDPFYTEKALTGRIFREWNPVLNIWDQD